MKGYDRALRDVRDHFEEWMHHGLDMIGDAENPNEYDRIASIILGADFALSEIEDLQKDRNMKKVSYLRAVEWVMNYDNSNKGHSVEEIEKYPTVELISDLFGVSELSVAQDVARHRRKNGIPVGMAE